MCDLHAPPVDERHLRLWLGEVAGHQPVAHQALRAGLGQGAEQRCQLPGGADPSGTTGASEPFVEPVGVQVLPPVQGVTDGDQFGRRERGSQVEERLGS